MFTLAISCLIISNVLWFVDQRSRFLCNICLYSIRLCFHHQSHPQASAVFALTLSLHSFWSYSPLISHRILGTNCPGEFIFQCSIIFAFSCCSFDSQGMNTEVIYHSFLQWTTFFQNSPPWPIHLGWPYTAWLIVSLKQVNKHL